MGHLDLVVKLTGSKLETARLERGWANPLARASRKNEGEDYLYPAEYFTFLDLPQEIERALSRAA